MSAEGGDLPHAAVPPPPFLSAPAPAAVLAALPGARAVGGCVRDALAARPVHDVDVAAPFPPEEAAPLLRRAGLKVFETGLAPRTVTAGGAPAPAALAAIRAAVPGLARLSAERVWMELKRLLAAPDPSGAAALMAETGALGAVLPEGTELPALARLAAIEGAPPDPLLRFAALLPEGTETSGLASRLRMSGAEAATLAALRGPAPPPDGDEAALRRALAERGHAALLGRLWLAEARGAAAAGDLAALRRRLAAMDRPEFPLQGRDVLALGVPPGPEVGRLLGAARSWWMERGCADGAEACRAKLRELAAARLI